MPIIKIKVQEKLLNDLVNYIGQFGSEEMQIIDEASKTEYPNVSDSETQYLQESLQRLESGKGKTYTIKELNDQLDQTIHKSEG